MAYEWHRPLEGRPIRFALLTFAAVLVGGLVLLVPPFFLQGTMDPLPGMRPYSALELEGRDLYIREGCNTCHSQMIRPLAAETERYGHYTVAGEGSESGGYHHAPVHVGLYGWWGWGPPLGAWGWGARAWYAPIPRRCFGCRW